MFDLLGVFNFLDLESPRLPGKALPSLPWLAPDRILQTVDGPGWRVQFASHPVGLPSFHKVDGTCLFVVGEARLRADAPPNQYTQAGELVSAASILDLFRMNPHRFIHWIKGNFILVFLHEDERLISLYHSRFGISSFYYGCDGKQAVFSTSLAAAAVCLPQTAEVDLAAVAELALFSYPLGDRTYFKSIKMLRPAEMVKIKARKLELQYWWDVRTLYDAPLYSRIEALEIGSELFSRTVNKLISDVKRVRVSFTSGFDSRAIMSVLHKEPAELLAYSFGIPGSLNVSIPKQICAEQGIPYYPIVLDGAYEKVFDDYAWRALLLSDCLSTVERANYPFAFEQLAGFSPVVLTGLFGSELMRTFQNVGIMVSETMARLNTSSNGPLELKTILRAPDAGDYLASQVLERNAAEVEADVTTALWERFSDLPPDRRFYMYMFTEGLRKYFGAELQMERPWGINRFPFLDDEFAEFAFRAPFAGVHARTLQPTVENRFQSQYFYAYVIRKYRPELLDGLTDHGYAPRDVISPLALLRIGPQFLYRRWQRQRAGYREFKTEEWTERLFRQRLFQNAPRADLFSGKLVEDFQNGSWKGKRLEFAKAASLKLWLEILGEGKHQAVISGN